MGGMWILFIPFLILIYTDSEEDKKVEQTHQTIRKTSERKSRNV